MRREIRRMHHTLENHQRNQNRSMSPEFPTNPLRVVFTPEPVPIIGLGERLLKFRTELRMSRTDLANHIGASPNMIRNWEKRASSPDFVHRQRLANLFDKQESIDPKMIVGRQLPLLL